MPISKAGNNLAVLNMTHRLKDNQGFTLIEIIIVVTILAIMSVIVVPRISHLFDTKRSNFNILTAVIAKTFEESFIKGNIDFLLIHLYEPMESETDDSEVFSRSNGVSVVVRNKSGKYEDINNKYLKYKEFSDSFRIEEVLLSTGERVTTGNVLVPFYPAGYSDNVILHILINEEEKWSVRIYKMRKEAEIFPEYIDFSEQY